MDHILHLGAHRFHVIKNKATLRAFVSNATNFKLCWGIDIPCEGAEVVEDGETYLEEPKAYHEAMRFACRDWKQLVRQHDLADIDYVPAIYFLNEHQDLDQSDIRIIARRGVEFDIDWRFKWSGRKCGVKTTVRFMGATIWLDAVTDAKAARRRLEQDLDLSGFGPPRKILDPSAGPRFTFKPIP